MADDREKVEACLSDILKKKDAKSLSLRQIRGMVQVATNVETSAKPMKSIIEEYVEKWLKKNTAEEGRGEGEGEGEAEGEAVVEAEEDKEKEAEGESGEKEEGRRERGKEKRKPARESKGDDDEDLICELSGKRKVSISNFRGKLLVSIRDYYEKNGEMLPTSKGISLSVEQWKALREGMPAIKEAIKSFQ